MASEMFSSKVQVILRKMCTGLGWVRAALAVALLASADWRDKKTPPPFCQATAKTIRRPNDRILSMAPDGGRIMPVDWSTYEGVGGLVLDVGGVVGAGVAE